MAVPSSSVYNIGSTDTQPGAVDPEQQANSLALHYSEFPLNQRPTCPSVLIPFEATLYALPVNSLKVEVEFNVSTAFVKIQGRWKNVANYASDCMFALPLTGTVTKASIKMKSRRLETVVIPRGEANALQPGASETEDDTQPGSSFAAINPAPEGEATDGATANPYETYIPNLFRLPIPNVNPDDEIHITVWYLEPLYFLDGQYQFNLPLKFGPNLYPAEDMSLDEVIDITCTINSVSSDTTYECNSYHEMKKLEDKNNTIRLKARNLSVDRESGIERTHSEDFNFSYTMVSREVVTTLIKDETEDDGGTFVLFVTPPSFTVGESVFHRQIVFMLDRSGSMTGEPFAEACRALMAALDTLQPGDAFNVIAFDHEAKEFSRGLTPMTEEAKGRVATWITSQNPSGGGTDINKPLQGALRNLSESKAGGDTLPFVVLITDGCVQNERDICRETLRSIKNCRILTFGIGFYCNWYFLKMLAQIGRGFSDVVVYKDNIYPQMEQLMHMAEKPVITNISLDLKNLKNVELYPHPLPDLFMGAPLTVAGKFQGQFPETITMHGQSMDGSPFEAKVSTRTSDVIPVSKVFLKERIDILTARAWLRESKELRREVTDLSCSMSMPCAYTTMVAYEAKGNFDPDEEFKTHKDKPWYRDRRKLAALTGGGAVLLGAAAFSFGDLGASMANTPVIGALGGAGDFLSGGCCECGDCGLADCADCLAC